MPELCEPLLIFARPEFEVGKAVEDRVAFPIAIGCDVVDVSEKAAVFCTQHAQDFVQAPNVELAFFAFGICIKRGREPSAICDHFAFDPFDCLGHARLEQR